MYDNQLGPGKSPSLSSFESYGQVLQCLVDKAFKGLKAHCPACTCAMFKTEEKVKVKSVVMVPQKPCDGLRGTPWWETCGRSLQEGTKCSQRMGTTSRSGNSGLKMDEGAPAFVYGCAAGFLVASEAPNRWWWGVKPDTLPADYRLCGIGCQPWTPLYARPAPSSLNIGHWLWEDHDVDDRQQWIEAYACSLQCVAEASVGQSLDHRGWNHGSMSE